MGGHIDRTMLQCLASSDILTIDLSGMVTIENPLYSYNTTLW